MSLPQSSCSVEPSEALSDSAPPKNRKPRIAIFSLTSCEGCSLAILELEDKLLDIVAAVDIVNFREGMSERDWDIDIGFVDGSVSTPQDEEELRHLRQSSKILVAIGACACLGGINTLKLYQPKDEYRQNVYGDKAMLFPTADSRPLSAVVKVDYELPGCPMVKEEFLRFVTCMIAQRPFRLPNFPVCVECKQRGVLCTYERGEICLGPVTRAGCNAICPYFGLRCTGCRGVIDDRALQSLGRNVQEQYSSAADDVLADLHLFGAFQGSTLP